jgi:hypothetical protein
MQKTTLPSGKQSTTEPQAGVARSDGVSAEAAGAARTPTETAIAVAARTFVILVDITYPLARVKFTFDSRISCFTLRAVNARQRNVKVLGVA